jgi:hypothetical protein
MIPYLLAIAGGYLIGDATKDKQLFGEGGVVYVGYEMWNDGLSMNLNFKDTWRGGRKLHTTSTTRQIIKVGDKYEVRNPHRRPSLMFGGKKFNSIEEAKEAVLNYYNINRSNGRGKDPDYGKFAEGGGISGIDNDGGGISESEQYHYKMYLELKHKAEELLNSDEMPSKSPLGDFYETPKKGTRSYDVGKRQLEYSDKARSHYSKYLKLKNERKKPDMPSLAKGGKVGDTILKSNENEFIIKNDKVDDMNLITI